MHPWHFEVWTTGPQSKEAESPTKKWENMLIETKDVINN